MAGIRGIRNPFPLRGDAPTGIFSTKGQQKQDGASGPEMGTYGYSHGNANDKNGVRLGKGGAGNSHLRHQAPKKGY